MDSLKASGAVRISDERTIPDKVAGDIDPTIGYRGGR